MERKKATNQLTTLAMNERVKRWPSSVTCVFEASGYGRQLLALLQSSASLFSTRKCPPSDHNESLGLALAVWAQRLETGFFSALSGRLPPLSANHFATTKPPLALETAETRLKLRRRSDHRHGDFNTDSYRSRSWRLRCDRKNFLVNACPREAEKGRFTSRHRVHATLRAIFHLIK
jgi:hypothetical protein